MFNRPAAGKIGSSKSPMASLSIPEDVIIEICNRLPVKSLISLKCVNKGWRDLISSSDFAISLFNLNKHKPLLYRRWRVCLDVVPYKDESLFSVYNPTT